MKRINLLQNEIKIIKLRKTVALMLDKKYILQNIKLFQKFFKIYLSLTWKFFVWKVLEKYTLTIIIF